MTNLTRITVACMACLSAAALPAAFAGPPMDAGAAQVAERPTVSDARGIEARLYRQGYHRVSHIDREGAAYTARALDANDHPVFLGIEPGSGAVIEAHPMD